MLRSFFQSIPLSLEEAALIDGVHQLQAMVRIVVPLAMPGIISSAIFTFVLVWNEYTLALFFISNNSLKTLPLGMADFTGITAYQWEIS